MSTNSSGKRGGVFVMPERFSFSLEEREGQETEIATGESTSEMPTEACSEPICDHRWEELPEDRQTLASESKIIWQCHSCGEKTSTYSWKKP